MTAQLSPIEMTSQLSSEMTTNSTVSTRDDSSTVSLEMTGIGWLALLEMTAQLSAGNISSAVSKVSTLKCMF